MTRTTTTIVTDEDGTELSRDETRLYTLAELKELGGSGYDRALEKLAEWNTDHEWWDLDSEVDYIEEKYGFRYNPDNVEFDLYRREFTFGKSTDVDERKVLKAAGIDLRSKDARQIIEDQSLVLAIQRRGFTSDRGTIGYGGGYEGIWPDYIPTEITDKLDDLLRKAEHEMLKSLTDEQDYLSSEEALTEFALANDYHFDEHGEVPS